MKRTGAASTRDTHLRGFTLIEVAVVAAIIALLTALLLASLAQARRQADRTACASNLRLFGLALHAYRIELGRYPLPGDRDPNRRPHDLSRHVSGSRCRINPCADRWNLVNIGSDLAAGLVREYLNRPEPMYCPSSLQRDRWATRPFVARTNGHQDPVWKTTGDTSYVYLAGIRMPFADAEGQATYDPAVESPDRTVNRVNGRAVLLGDRTIDLTPDARNVPGSNHGRLGGHFFYTNGEVQWYDRTLLTPHPGAKTYVWFWPRVARGRG